jgi:hypothetical protein
MAGINLHDTDYLASTSTPPWRRTHDRLDCLRCGSSLIGRREAVERRTTLGIQFVVETFRCRCGRGRRIERQEAGA